MITSSGRSASAIAMIDALPHAAGELMRIGAHAARSMPTSSSSSPACVERGALRDALVRAHHVDELVADAHHRVERVHRALEDHRDVAPAELAQLLAALAGRRRRPSKRIWPPAIRAGGRRICMTAFASVLLPQPDSPASPRISPRAISRSTPSTARTTTVADAVLDGRGREARRAVVAAHAAASARGRASPRSRRAPAEQQATARRQPAQPRVRDLVDARRGSA